MTVRPTRLAVILAGFGLALFGVGRTTGSGWVMVIVSSVAALVVLAAISPAVGWARVRVAVAAPADAVAGRPVDVDVTLSGPRTALKVCLKEPPGEWMAAAVPSSGTAIVVPPRRGVVEDAVVEVEVAGVLGLVRWRRTHRVRLDRPIEVAPAPTDEQLPAALTASLAGDRSPANGAMGADSVRSVREYTVGDPTRLVHWAATARRGELMVKELEDPDSLHLAVVVDLRGDSENDAERAASRAAGVVAAALRATIPITLLTAERGGPVAGRVTSALDAGRRLARAIPGRPPDGPVPPGATVFRIEA